jgi:hypothetical protein
MTLKGVGKLKNIRQSAKNMVRKEWEKEDNIYQRTEKCERKNTQTKNDGLKIFTKEELKRHEI